MILSYFVMFWSQRSFVSVLRSDITLLLSPYGMTAGRPHVHHMDEAMHRGHDETFHNLPHSHVMFHHVETACARDVEDLCSPIFFSPLKSNEDPLFDWIFFPLTKPSPEIQDFKVMMDRLFDQQFLQPSRDFITLYVLHDEPEQAPHFLVDSAAAKVAQEREPEEIPKLANDLQAYGNQMLAKLDEGSHFQRKMARRLSEMDAHTLLQQVSLPFGCSKNRCLRRAFMEGKLSPECRTSISSLESTFALETALEQRQEAFLFMISVYLCVLTLLGLLIGRRMRGFQRSALLAERILQAVYSRPATRRQVELDLDHSVGSAPPLLTRAVRDPDEKLWINRMRVTVFLILLALCVFAPFWVLPACIVLSSARVVRLFLLPSTEEPECTCCCCGLNSTDAANGIITEEQECCSCCMGTGVCKPACEDCCGPKGSCCLLDDEECFVVDVELECCCCCSCCGLSENDAREGNITEEQTCCCCCGGTGKCGAAGKCGATGSSCCGNTGKECSMKGQGEKHVIPAKNEIYCGIPVQVV